MWKAMFVFWEEPFLMEECDWSRSEVSQLNKQSLDLCLVKKWCITKRALLTPKAPPILHVCVCNKYINKYMWF